jgi:hypothetical protein
LNTAQRCFLRRFPFRTAAKPPEGTDKVLAENLKPHLAGGKHKVIDETWKEDTFLKESEDGEIKE